MASFTAIIDASALYSMTITDLVIELARTGVFRACWSEDIHDEWIRNLTVNRPDLDPLKITMRRRAMDAALPDCLIENYRYLIPVCAVIRRRFPVGASPTRRTRSSRKQSEQSWR